MGQHKRTTMRILVPVAMGLLILAAVAGCSRVTAKIDSYSPSDPGSPVRVEAGKPVTLSVTFTNTGNRTGTFLVRAVVRDSLNVQVGPPSQTVTVDPGKSRTVTWEHIVTAPGTYTVQFIVGRDANTTLAQLPANPAPLIVGLPTVVSTAFQLGDRVRVTTAVNVRTGPGTTASKVTHVNYRDVAPAGVEGKVVGGPDKADGYVWWRVEFDAGYTGWCIEDALTKVSGG